MENSDKVKKIVREIDKFLSNMPEEERRIFFIEMGFKMTEKEKSIINEPAKYLREAAYTGKQFQPGPLHRKTVIEDSKTTDANHDLTAISEAIEQCQVVAELESAANPTIYSGNNEQPQNNMEESDIASAEKIIKELDENLSKMTEKEREELFKECGLVFEKIPNQNEERHKQLIKLKAALQAVLELRKQSDSNTKTTMLKPTFEEIQKMMAFMTTPYKPPFTVKGTRHETTPEEIERMQMANERIEEGNHRELEAKAAAEEKGITYKHK